MNNTTLYALTVLIWGSTWFAIEFQLGTVAPEVSLVYRYGAGIQAPSVVTAFLEGEEEHEED